MPLWAAIAIVVAAFAVRALLRGWSFDRTDALVVALFVVVLITTALVREWVRRTEADEDPGKPALPDRHDESSDDPSASDDK